MQIDLQCTIFQQDWFKAQSSGSKYQRAVVELGEHLLQQPEFIEANRERQLALFRRGLSNFQNLTAEQEKATGRVNQLEKSMSSIMLLKNKQCIALNRARSRFLA